MPSENSEVDPAWCADIIRLKPSASGMIEALALASIGKIVHLTEPEYQGNPISGDKFLVFEILGWDILDRAQSVAFETPTCVTSCLPGTRV